MKNVDMILQYCMYNDYPIFRAHIAKYRNMFKKIILYPSFHHGHIDFGEFAKKVIPETWVEPVKIDYGKEDWRQAETTPCLKHSDAEWIWFCEQDWFVKDWDKFYNDIEKQMKIADMIGWWNDSEYPYIHPCCLFIKRELFEKTNKDFRAHPEIDGCDHFAMLTRDVERLKAKIVKVQELGYKNWEDAFHLGGLTYPYQDFKGRDTIFGVGNKEAFYIYNYMARDAQVEQSPEWLDLSLKIENVMNDKFPEFKDINRQNNRWIKFFK